MIFYLSKSWVRLKVRYIGANADRRFRKQLQAWPSRLSEGRKEANKLSGWALDPGSIRVGRGGG